MFEKADTSTDKITLSVNCDSNGSLRVDIFLADGIDYSSVEYTCYNTSTSGMLEVSQSLRDYSTLIKYKLRMREREIEREKGEREREREGEGEREWERERERCIVSH